MSSLRFAALSLLAATPAACQNAGGAGDPFPDPIEADAGVIEVGLEDFARLPDIGGSAARPMRLVDEPGTGRMFANDMRGHLYAVGYDGAVSLYLNVDDDRWGIPVESSGRERGFQSFAIHPQFGEEGAPGYGKIYAWTDTEDRSPDPDFVPGGGDNSHDTVLLEWTAQDATASTYDGGPPRQLLRVEQPFGNHNGGHVAFSPLASPGDADFGMLYVGNADGGSGGDPLDLGQDLTSAFGKIFRIDPLGTGSANGQYGIPSDNPFVTTADALGEIFVLGVRNPQRFGWDPANGNLFVADIGQNHIEELSLAWSGADLGWNTWEGSYGFISREAVDMDAYRSDSDVSYPVAEYGHPDPLLGNRAAVTGVVAYRSDRVPQLQDRVLFGDFPSGEVFHIPADDLPEGGEEGMRRVLFRGPDGSRTFLDVIREENERQGRELATRTDLRIDEGPDGRLFLLNKHDGVIREIVP